MKILITGVAGFVGSSLARAILEQNPNSSITGIDNFSFGYRERILDLVGKFEFIEADVVDIPRVLAGREFDVIVHCAAIAPLPECQRDSYRALSQNVAICGTIADYALSSGTRNIVFFSSGAIYEKTTSFPTDEEVEVSTSLVYPTTKHLAELYFEAMCRSHEINVTSIRLFNLYGPHQDYFRKQPPLIGYLLACILRKEEATLFSSGDQCRDYVYIDDLLELVMLSARKMIASDTGGNYVAVNAGSGAPISVNSIIKILDEVSGSELLVKRMPATQYWDKYPELFERKITINKEVIESEVNKHTEAAVDKAFRELGWASRIGMKTGLAACFAHAKQILIN